MSRLEEIKALLREDGCHPYHREVDWLVGEVDRLLEERTDALTANDLYLFYGMLNDRQRQAEADGIGPDDPSSVYRLKLLNQLRRRVIRQREREAYQVERLRELLARLEWAGRKRSTMDRNCPVCHGWPANGHDPGCELAAALAGNDG